MVVGFSVAFLLIFTFFLARFISAYHPELLLRQHIDLQDFPFVWIWVSEAPPLFSRSLPNRRAYRNLFVIPGLVFHALWIVVLLFSLLFLRFGPTGATPFSEALPPVLKDAVVIAVLLLFLGIELSFYLLNNCKIAVFVVNRAFQWFYWVMVALVFGMSASCVVLIASLFAS